MQVEAIQVKRYEAMGLKGYFSLMSSVKEVHFLSEEMKLKFSSPFSSKYQTISPKQVQGEDFPLRHEQLAEYSHTAKLYSSLYSVFNLCILLLFVLVHAFLVNF